MGLANHPFGVRLKRAGRADHSASAKMNKHQNKRLPQASRRPDNLAEEIDLAERIDVGLEELVPGSATSLGAGLDTFFLEDVLDGRLRNTPDTKFSEFSEDPVVSPASFSGEADDGLSNRVQGSWSAHLLRLSAQFLFTDPALVGPRMDNDNRFVGAGAEFCSQLEQSFFLFFVQKDPLFGNQLASHHELFFENVTLPAQLVLCASGQIEQKRRKPTCLS